MMRSRGGDFERALGIGLAVDVGEVDVRRWSHGRLWGVRRRREWRACGPVRLELSEVVDAQHGRGGGDPRLSHVANGHVEAPYPEAVEVGDDRQRPADGAYGPVKCQLAQPCGIARQGTLLTRVDDRRRHRQVETTTLFWELRRRQVDGHSAAGEFKAAVVDGALDSLKGFLQRSIAETHDVKPREAIGDIRLHLDPDAIEAEDRSRKGPRQHRIRSYTSLCICVSLSWGLLTWDQGFAGRAGRGCRGAGGGSALQLAQGYQALDQEEQDQDPNDNSLIAAGCDGQYSVDRVQARDGR